MIFFGVGGLLIYTLIRFRAKKGAVAAQIHGSTRMEVSWTVGAALLLVVISVVTFAKLGQINDPPDSGPGGTPVTKSGAFVAAGAKQRLPPNGKSLSIEVNGQQYIWRYTYEDGDGNNLNNVYSYQQMVVPVDTTVTLKIRAQDVQHSWWIPALGGKFDAVPGYTNYTWFKATNARDLHGSVRRALRPQPREHDRQGHRGARGAVRGLVRPAEGEPQGCRPRRGRDPRSPGEGGEGPDHQLADRAAHG